jgi:hypothetical protein
MPLPVVAEKIERLRHMEEGGFGPQAGMRMSTLRDFVQAMAGDLEIRAVFPDRTMEMSNVSSLASKRKTTRPSSKKVAALTP